MFFYSQKKLWAPSTRREGKIKREWGERERKNKKMMKVALMNLKREGWKVLENMSRRKSVEVERKEKIQQNIKKAEISKPGLGLG